MTTSVNTLIAKIESLGVALKGDKDTKMVVVKLKEANGKSFEWSSWHVDTFENYAVGDVIEIEPKLVFKDGNKYPFRNVERVIGKRDASEINTLDVLAGQSTAPASTDGSALPNDIAKAIERRSIERQTSIKMVTEVYKAGCSVDDLDSVVEAILMAAKTVETFLAREGSLPNIPAPSGSVARSVSTSSNGTPTDSPVKMDTIGDLFTAVHKRYNGTRKPDDILSALSVASKEELSELLTPAEAWDQVQGMWDGPETKETLEEN